MLSLRGSLLALSLLCLVGLSAPTRAASFSADQKTEIEGIIKGYLLEHPEVLRDAITALDDREKMAEADARKKALGEMGGKIGEGEDAFVIGNPDGKVTLVEFFDYNCGYCKRALGDLDRLMKDNKDLRVVLRDFPILSPSSVDAAIIAGAAHVQFPGDKFWDFHRKLLATRGLVGKDQALAVAKDMGADMAQAVEGCGRAEDPLGDPGQRYAREEPRAERDAVLCRR